MELQAHCDRLRKKEEYPQLHTTSEHWTRVENLSLPNYLPPLSHSLPMRYHCAGITSETEVLKVFEAFRDRGRFTIYIASLWLLHILLAMNRIGIEEYRINLESSQLRCRLNINLIFFFFFLGIVGGFVGGVVQTLAWCPTGIDRVAEGRQLLAISVASQVEEYPTLRSSSKTESLLQIWDFGFLNNKG